MIETTEQVTVVTAPVQPSARGAMPAVALMSFSALLLELGLTRLFSVVLFYHFAFLAISIAMLGLGAGAVFACLRRQWLERWSLVELGTDLVRGQCADHFRHPGGCAALLGGDAPRLGQLRASDGPLPRGGSAVLRYRPIVFRRFRAAPSTDYAALLRRFGRRIAGLSRPGSSAQLHRRAQHDPVRRSCRGAGRSCMGRVAYSVDARGPGAFAAGADRGQLPRQADRHRVCERHEAGGAALRQVECLVTGRGGRTRLGQGDCDRCRRQHLPDEYRPAPLGCQIPARPHVGRSGAGQRAAPPGRLRHHRSWRRSRCATRRRQRQPHCHRDRN